MKKVLFGCFYLVLINVSCKKNSPTGDGNNSYMTTAPGTTWNYESIDNSAVTTSNYTLTSTSSDSTINARLYHIFTNTGSNGSSAEYYNVSGSDYYQYASLSTPLPLSELKYLVDNIPSGTSWTEPLAFTQTIAGAVTINFSAIVKYTIEEKGSTVSVGGKTYNDVIKVSTEITNPTINSSLPVPITIEPITQSIHAYFARKYGLVKRDFQLKVDINAVGTVINLLNQNTTTNLLSSSIQ
jgi:hypothetical protein